MTRRLKNLIAVLAPIALIMLIVPALCHSVEWTQYDREGRKWSVTVNKSLDNEWLNKQLNAIWDTKVSIEIITWRADKTSFVFFGGVESDWAALRKVMASIERNGKVK